MSRILWTGAVLFGVLGFVAAVILLSGCDDPAPAEPSGIELDIDRAKPRPPLKQPKAPKPAKGAKR